MKFSKLFLLLYIFCHSVSINAQSDIEQQLIEYETATVDRKITLFFDFFSNLEYIDKDSILYYIKDLQAEGISNRREDAYAMSNYGLAFYLRNNNLYKEAETTLNKSLNYYEKVGNDTLLAETYNALGNIAFIEGKSTKAEVFYNYSFNYSKRSGEKRFEMLSIFNLARIYIQQGKYDEAKSKILEYIDFHKSKQGQPRMLASAYGLLGELYLATEEYDKAIENFTRNMEVGMMIGVFETLANAYTNMAIAEFYKNNTAQSEQYFRFALGYRIKDNNKYKISEAYYNLGDFYVGVEKLDSAISNYNQSLEVAKSAAILGLQKDALMQLSSVYEELNMKDELVFTLQSTIELLEEINKHQNINTIAALNFSYEQTQNEMMNTGEIREEQLESQVEKFKSIFNNWSLVAIIGVIGLVVLIYFSRNSKVEKKTNEE